MACDFVEITCSAPHSVSIEDIGVHLPGRGSKATVRADVLAASRDYARCRPWVVVKPLFQEVRMPLWPFVKARAPAPNPAPTAPAEAGLSEIRDSVKRIEAFVESLVSRPSPAAPEVVAAHVRNIGAMPSVPAGLPGAPRLPGPGASSEPFFIPSKIAPDVSSSNIKVLEGEVEKQNMDEGVEALKKLRRGPGPGQ